jgi:5-methylthioribose kinase
MKIILAEKFEDDLHSYLVNLGMFERTAKVLNYSKAGEGNMNVVMRLNTSEGSFILKQSRDYVNKYPQILAPIERVAVEKAFFEIVNKDEKLAEFSPSVLHFDTENHLLILEDLGFGTDFLDIYKDHSIISASEIEALVSYLIRLHEQQAVDFPSNQAMKLLNHEHIFHFPYMEQNGFDLDSVQEGLQSLAMIYKTDQKLKREIGKVGEQYLNKGKALLHGDFYPGSWLKVGSEIKVIDPEFGFLGDPEFDFGVMLAHFEMALARGGVRERCKIQYKNERNFDEKLLDQYVGIEIMRRLIGIAQLPVNLSLEQKAVLLDKAKSLIL